MRNQDSRNTCTECGQSKPTEKTTLTPKEEFLGLITFHGNKELSNSLKLIHDLALYHSSSPIDEEEKAALFELKILWEGLERLQKS